MSRKLNAKVDEKGNLIFTANDIDPLCDFCCIPEVVPVAALLTETREVRQDHPPKLVSNGEWYVCRACLELVMRHDAKALVDRAAGYQLDKLGLGRLGVEVYAPVLRHDIQAIHAAALDQLVNWP